MNRAYFEGMKVVANKKVGDLLLDLYPAKAAFSLQKLSSSYTGSYVRVRRSSDDAESDFNSEQITNGTLTSFVGAGNDGFIRTMYDISGNGFDHHNTNDAKQMLIVENGQLITNILGLPSVKNATGDNTSGVHRDGVFLNNGEVTVFSVSSIQANGVSIIFDAAVGANFSSQGSLRIDGFSGLRLGSYNGSVNGSFITNTSPPLGTPLLRTSIVRNAGRELYVNEMLEANDNLSGGVNFSRANGTDIFGYRFVDSGGIQQGFEIIIYNSDQTANRTAIEANINNRYNIF